MKNNTRTEEENFSILKKRIEERLKIINNQRNSIEKRKKNRAFYKKITFAAAFIVLIAFFYVYTNDDLFASSSKKLAQEKLSFYQEQKFRDSVSLLAMDLDIEDKLFRKMVDSIDLAVIDKIDSLENIKMDIITSTPTKKHLQKSNSRKKLKTSASTRDIASFLQEEKIKESQENKKAKQKVAEKKDILIKEKPSKIEKVAVFAVFPGCDAKSPKRSCFGKKIQKFIRKNLNKKLFKKSGVGKVDVLFTITKDGFIKIIKIVGAINEVIKNEVVRVIESLPRIKPAIGSFGSKMAVNYSLSINI